MVLFMAMFSAMNNEKRAYNARRKELSFLSLEEELVRSASCGSLAASKTSKMTLLKREHRSASGPVVFKIWLKNCTDKGEGKTKHGRD